MQHQDSLKKEFLKRWITSLQTFSCSSKDNSNMTLLQRKKAIKLSADLAMAYIGNGRKSWSRAVITKAYEDRETRIMAKKMLRRINLPKCSSPPQHDPIYATFDKRSARKTFKPTSNIKNDISRKLYNFRKDVPRKLFGSSSNSYSKKVKARSVAKRLVKKRTQILKELVPGGECMDEYSLLKETLDYIVSLRTQVDVMHHLARNI